ncbi:DUF1236 domain-containing protein [Pinisolibacter sp.]|uniref:DUF1236 domain-containing protein n=1 Tax=Pinisolibacter sp. TaxID=2172024 RepID=UPI002FDC9F06
MKIMATTTAVAVLASLAFASPASADQSGGGALGGAAAGAVGGAIIGGPVGAVIGGVAGAVGGATIGTIAADDQVYVRTYVEKHPRDNVVVKEPIVIGKPLPSSVTVYEIEGNPKLAGYRYAYVNQNYVLVDGDGMVVGTIVH